MASCLNGTGPIPWVGLSRAAVLAFYRNWENLDLCNVHKLPRYRWMPKRGYRWMPGRGSRWMPERGWLSMDAREGLSMDARKGRSMDARAGLYRWMPERGDRWMPERGYRWMPERGYRWMPERGYRWMPKRTKCQLHPSLLFRDTQKYAQQEQRKYQEREWLPLW